MNIIDIIIPLILTVITLKQLIYMKELLVPIKKSSTEIISVLFGIVILLAIISYYSNKWIHYITGLLAIMMFISIWIKQGISPKGFISMYKNKEIILWREIGKVTVINSKDITIKLYGSFMEQTFHFKNNDYEKIITILKENLPVLSDLEIIDSK